MSREDRTARLIERRLAKEAAGTILYMIQQHFDRLTNNNSKRAFLSVVREKTNNLLVTVISEAEAKRRGIRQ